MGTSEARGEWRYDYMTDRWRFGQTSTWITLEAIHRAPKLFIQDQAVRLTGVPLPEAAWPDEPLIVRVTRALRVGQEMRLRAAWERSAGEGESDS